MDMIYPEHVDVQSSVMESVLKLGKGVTSKIGSRILKKQWPSLLTYMFEPVKKMGPLPKQAAAIAVPHTFKKKTVQRNLVGSKRWKLYLQNPSSRMPVAHWRVILW